MRIFAVLTVAVIGVSIWFAVTPGAWRSFENQYGPIRAMITLVLAAAIALLGLKRTAAAGVLLLVLGPVPVAVSSMGTRSGFGSLAAVSLAPVVSGILYLLSARATGQSAPTEHAEAGPGELPKAA